jgi:hypothetical protein
MASSARSIESSAQSMAGSATAQAGGGNGTGSTAPPPNTPAAQAPAADRGGPPASTVQNANMKSAPPGSANG